MTEPDLWVQPALLHPALINAAHVVEMWPGYDAANIPTQLVDAVRAGRTSMVCPATGCTRSHPWVLFLDDTHPVQLDCTRGDHP